MSSVTVRFDPPGQVGADLQVNLIEPDGRRTSAPLTNAALTTHDWTVNLDALPQPPATDIASYVAEAARNGREHANYRQIAETLYDWLLPAGPIRDRWHALGGARL